MHKRFKKGHQELLVLWAACPLEDATWEPFDSFVTFHPDFEQERKAQSQDG